MADAGEARQSLRGVATRVRQTAPFVGALESRAATTLAVTRAKQGVDGAENKLGSARSLAQAYSDYGGTAGSRGGDRYRVSREDVEGVDPDAFSRLSKADRVLTDAKSKAEDENKSILEKRLEFGAQVKATREAMKAGTGVFAPRSPQSSSEAGTSAQGESRPARPGEPSPSVQTVGATTPSRNLYELGM